VQIPSGCGGDCDRYGYSAKPRAENLRLDLNSVGNPEDRQHYRQALVDYLTPYKDELEDSQSRLSRNPLRILDSKDKRKKLPKCSQYLDYLGSYSQRHFEQVQQLLIDLGINYKLNPRLVRGLDYYTTAFEIQSDDLGAQATVAVAVAMMDL